MVLTTNRLDQLRRKRDTRRQRQQRRATRHGYQATAAVHQAIAALRRTRRVLYITVMTTGEWLELSAAAGEYLTAPAPGDRVNAWTTAKVCPRPDCDGDHLACPRGVAAGLAEFVRGHGADGFEVSSGFVEALTRDEQAATA